MIATHVHWCDVLVKSPAHIGTYRILTVSILAFAVINAPGISTQLKIKL